MQKRVTALNPGLVAALCISAILHVGLLNSSALQPKSQPAEITIDSGITAVELTLMPSIASTPSIKEPTPIIKEIDPIVEPQQEEIQEPIITPPEPTTEEPTIIQPEVIEETTPPEPEAQQPLPEQEKEQPESTIESIDQDGALEEDKGVLTEATPLNSCTISYPPFSRRRGEEGSVTLSFNVTETGAINTIQIIQSSGHKRLDKAAIKAIQKATFKPAERFGKPCSSTLTETFTFRLTDD